MNKTEHTPTPWQFEKHNPSSRYYGNIVGYYPKKEGEFQNVRTISCQLKYGTEEENEANAAFIVKAVNHHEELVEMVRKLKKIVADQDEDLRSEFQVNKWKSPIEIIEATNLLTKLEQ